MSSKWPLVKLGEHIDSSLGKMLDKNKNKGVLQPYLGNSNVRWGAFEIDDLAQMKFEEHEAERYGITEGDLIVCEGGEPGRCAIWLDERPNIKIQKALHRVRTKKTLHNYYLYYWFLFAGYKGTLEPYFTGTTIKHLTGKALKNLDIRLPPIAYQEWAVAKLKCLDDKIKANKSINQTLEKIAQAIFKSWFVDFEPTKAKIAAREALLTENPDATPEQIATAEQQAAIHAIAGAGDVIPTEQLRTIADLFPNKLINSELGDIPEGWRVNKVENVITRLKAKQRYTKKQVERHGKVPVFEQGAGIVLGYHNGIAGFNASPEKPMFIFGDHTCVTHLSCEPFDVSANVIPLEGNNFPTLWVYQAVKDLQKFQEYRRHWSEFVIKQVVTPATVLAELYSRFATDFIKMKEVNVAKISVLTQVRDSLLPQLLSGKLLVDGEEAK